MTIELARVWLSKHLGGHPVDHFTDDEVRSFVEGAYPGGYAALTDVPAPVTFKSGEVPFWAKDRGSHFVRDLPDTPIRQRARVQGLTGFKMPAHAEWVDAKVSTTEIVVHLIVREVKEETRRVKVLREGQRLVRWSRPEGNGYWGRAQELTVWDDDPSYDVHIFGAIMTPEVAADKREQFETCWRPGTDRTPMQGPAARAEMSWKQYWDGDLPTPKAGKK